MAAPSLQPPPGAAVPGRVERGPVERARRAILEHRLGKSLERLVRQEAWRALGFVRLPDYLSERLGMGLRTAQELLRTEKALARLPRTAAAWMSGRISSGHLRILTRVATERTESWWLMVAARLPVSGLAAEVARWRRARVESAEDVGPASSLQHVAPEGDIDEEPECKREDVRAPAWVVVLWRQTVEHVRRVAGRRLPLAACLDVLLAEAQGTAPVGVPDPRARGSPAPEPSPEDEEEPRSRAATRAPSGASRAPALSIIDRLMRRPFEPGRVPWWQLLPVREGKRDPRALDEEMRSLLCGRQREEAELARWLRRAAVTRSYRSEGYKTLESWCREALGLSVRRMYYLLALNRRLEALPALHAAFLEGRLTMRQALLVGSVATRATEAAWILRAMEVTSRRLDDEVSWWRHLKEVRPEVWALMKGGPLPAGLVLEPGHHPRLHACAQAGSIDRRETGQGCQGAQEATHDNLHGCAQQPAVRRSAHGAEGATDFAEDPDQSPRLHAYASRTGGDEAAREEGNRAVDGGTGLAACLPGYAPPGQHAHGLAIASESVVIWPEAWVGGIGKLGSCAPPEPVTASGLLEALEADEAAVPLPKRMTNITFWLEPEVHSMWKVRCAASFHESGQPMVGWEVLALLMYNFLKTWENEDTRRQRREHATLERDGWRCTAPGCTSMGSGMLHEHHIVYRSRGGAIADPTNVTTLCTAHHQGLLHGGLMRCYGEAPDNLTWELGVGDGQEPFLIYGGERLVGGTGKR